MLKCVISYYLSSNFRLLSIHLLKHFEQDQLKEFVQTITSKNNTRKIRSFVGFFESARVDDPDTEVFVLDSLNSIEPGWTKEHLVFEDEKGDGTTSIYGERRKPICYWRQFIKDVLDNHESRYDLDYNMIRIENSSHGLQSREDVDCFSECFKWVDDSSAKKLLLHEDSQSFIMISFVQKMVKFMLCYLSEEDQEDVKLQWKNKAPHLDRWFPINPQTFTNYNIYPHRWSNSL